jgi:Zn-dependent protease
MLYIVILLSIILHELGHIIAILITKAGKIKGIHVSLKGIGIRWEGDNPSLIHRIIISSSGSLVNIIIGLILIYLQMYEYALFNIIFGILNLIPFLKGDGYNIVRVIKEHSSLV